MTTTIPATKFPPPKLPDRRPPEQIQADYDAEHDKRHLKQGGCCGPPPKGVVHSPPTRAAYIRPRGFFICETAGAPANHANLHALTPNFALSTGHGAMKNWGRRCQPRFDKAGIEDLTPFFGFERK